MLLSFLIIVFEINIAFIFFFIIRYNSLVVASVIVIASADRSPGMARHQTNLLGVEWNVKACSVTRWMSCIALFKLFVIFFQTVNISLRYNIILYSCCTVWPGISLVVQLVITSVCCCCSVHSSY